VISSATSRRQSARVDKELDRLGIRAPAPPPGDNNDED
jgi:hypothetical protein